MTFDDTSAAADQEFELQTDVNGTLEYSTKYVLFYKKNNKTFFCVIIFFIGW